MYHFSSSCVCKYHQSLVKYVSGGRRVSFAAAWWLWTTVSQGFMTQWDFDECYKWSGEESIMPGMDWTQSTDGACGTVPVRESERKQQGDIICGTKWCPINEMEKATSIWNTESAARPSPWILKGHISGDRKRNCSRLGLLSKPTSSPHKQWVIWQ